MRLLTIDTSTRIGSVAAADGDRIIRALESTEQTRHAERLLDLVAAVLDTAGWKLQELDLVACGMGPGSFTGVRVGMATAKGLCSAAGLPMVGVVSLQAMEHAARTLHGPGATACLLDAKKGEVFAAVYDAQGTPLAAPVHLPASQAGAWLADAPAGVRVCGEIAAALDLDGLTVLRGAQTDLPAASSMAALAVEAWSRQPRSQLHELEPLYVRPPDISSPKGRQ